ncbi:MAG: uridine phosphorylase [Pseudomonadota bacterium]
MTRAWYLGHAPEDVADRAILVGDPERVDRIAGLLDAPTFLPVKRGLKTVTGLFRGSPVTVAAFGMGAPIATIVLHELAALGTASFIRIGTAMYFPPGVAADLLISASALSFEGTSQAYRQTETEPVADQDLIDALNGAARAAGAEPRVGRFATFDAFYRDMFGIDPSGHAQAAKTRDMLIARGVLASDMETSALLTAAQALGVSAATLCLGTVDGITQDKLSAAPLDAAEVQMFGIALAAITESAA